MNFLRFDHGETVDMLRESVRDFAAKEIAPRAAETSTCSTETRCGLPTDRTPMCS